MRPIRGKCWKSLEIFRKHWSDNVLAHLLQEKQMSHSDIIKDFISIGNQLAFQAACRPTALRSLTSTPLTPFDGLNPVAAEMLTASRQGSKPTVSPASQGLKRIPFS